MTSTMTLLERFFIKTALILAAIGLVASGAAAQTAQTPLRITQKIEEGNLITLRGNTRPEATALNDRGALPYETHLDHMLLQLTRSPQQEQALEKYIDQLTRRGSPNYHKWLTAQQFGERYGLAEADISTITNWLSGHGFTVNVVFPSRMVIDFSGTVGQVQEAFHTEIHAIEANGAKHIANMSDPRIPAALAPAVAGVNSLHDFRPTPAHKMKPAYTFSADGGTAQFVVPGDLAKIYNLNPLFTASTSGQSQTVVVLEDTDLFSNSDWSTFRSTFGLSTYSGTLTTAHPAPPSGTNNCTDPGTNGDDSEAALDAEWASAAAPSAAIELASCSNTNTTSGIFLAMQNLLNESATPPAVMSLSYTSCEAQNGAAANVQISSAYQQAATEGVSLYAAAGDEGAASCDANQPNATHGIGVSGLASTAYNVAVGGTDFGDTYAGTNSTYWSSTNSATYESALSYIPEIPWNDSCASVLIATALSFSQTYGASGLCQSSTATADDFIDTAAGSGGPSGCATGAPATSGVVGGTCAGYAKPSWQSVVGNPSDGVRDLPDVSLFAGNGVWGHAYIFCFSDTANGGAACTGAPSGWAAGGGTSFATPIWAGFQALINQKIGLRQGNPNPNLYTLASTEYGAGGSSSCNSTNGNAVGTSCIFYDVTLGDMDIVCTGTNSCFNSGSSSTTLPVGPIRAYPTWSRIGGVWIALALGLALGGFYFYRVPNQRRVSTVAAAAILAVIVGFSACGGGGGSSSSGSYTLSASPASVTIAPAGASGASTITVNATGGFSGSVTLSTASLPAGVSATFSPNPTNSSSSVEFTATSAASAGTTGVTINGVSGSNSETTSISLTISSSASGSNYGVLSTSNSSYQIAYGTGTGWDFATGIGTVNVTNLVNNWPH